MSTLLIAVIGFLFLSVFIAAVILFACASRIVRDRWGHCEDCGSFFNEWGERTDGPPPPDDIVDEGTCEICWALKISSGVCNHRPEPFRDHPTCPDCGYTYCDAKFHMDHTLCGQPEPKPPEVVAVQKMDDSEKQQALPLE